MRLEGSGWGLSMNLQELLKDVVDVSGMPPISVGGLCQDSRLIRPGDLFFALPGCKVRGSQYMAEAAKGGASAVVLQDEPDPALAVCQVKVPDARLALAHAAAAFYQRPTRRFYLCGVTGTNGKTTVTYLLESIWSAQDTGVIGTVNYRYRDRSYPAGLTTPDTISIQKLFAEFAREGIGHVAIEASSHALEQKRVHAGDFDSAVFTNLTQDHLDYHGDMEAYFDSKLSLFRDVLPASAKKDKIAVINRDDPYGARVIETVLTTGVPVKTFSLSDERADVFVRESRFTIQGTKATLSLEGKTRPLKTSLLGAHNLRNILAAVLVGRHSGCPIDEICHRVRFVSVPGRLERVGSSNIFVDYAHTPDALQNVLDALNHIRRQDPRAGRLIAVFGCGGDRDRKKRPLMGAAAASRAGVVLITSDNPRTEDPERIIADILPGVEKYQKKYDGSVGYLVEPDRRRALEKMLSLARPEDVVVVAGKGHEDYQIVGTEKRPFSDVAVLRECGVRT